MPDFAETMRRKGQAEEDIYFARLDRELVQAMHRKNAEALSAHQHKQAKKLEKSYRKDLEALAEAHRRDHEKLAKTYWKRIQHLLHKQNQAK